MAEAVLQFDAVAMAEDVPQQLGKRLSDVDLASRKAEEASLRRYDAFGWLRKMVGDVAGKDFPAQPSEEEFRLCLRSGIILCNALNKVQPGAVPKVVEAPSIIVPDGAALCAFQYFENVRNFLDSIEEMGIPAFEASDLEQGGKSSRIVNCVLALKSYSEWKEGGGKGVWKFSGSSKPHSAGKHFVRKNADLFMNSLSRSSSTVEKSLDSSFIDHNFFGDLVEELHEMDDSKSLHVFVRQLLSDKKREDIPVIVENMLGKVMEEFEHRLASQIDQAGTALQDTFAPRTDEDVEAGTTAGDMEVSSSNEDVQIEAGMTLQDMDAPSSSEQVEMKDGTTSRDIYVASPNEHVEASNKMEDKGWSENEDFHARKSKVQALKRKNLVEHHQKRIQVIKSTLHTTKEDLHKLCMKYQEEVQNLGTHLRVLAGAASRYQKVLEENRKLYNQVQDLKGNIRVYCRIRPFLSGQPNGLSAAEAIDEQTLSILTHSKNGKGKKLFTFNKVFGPTASQEAVFSDTQPLIRSVLDGYNICIFAYGQTGSGKTYTMTGPKELTPESLGVNYRAISDLFSILEQRKDSISYDVSVQMMEIYNEQVRDLLVTDVSNDSQNGINLPNTNLVPVTSTSDFNNLMDLGHKNQNSRSHCCINVYVRGRNLTSGSTTSGCMHLVDLAGGERVDKIDVDVDRSLSALGDVIYSLAQKQSRVPYKNSKLTQLLQHSLGGQAKILMFIHISPEPDVLGETISTLRFAERVSTVEHGAAQSGKDSTDVRELREQIASLKLALSRKERGELDVKAEHFVDRSWSPHGSLEPVEEETCISGDLVDGIKPPEMSQQKHNASKVHPEQPLNRISGNRQNSLDNGSVRTQYEIAETDEVEAETSGDSSELDYRWQTNVANKSNPNSPSGGGSKAKKPTPKQTKTPEKRSQIPQAPAKRGVNGMQKQGKKPSSVDGKRKPSKP